MPFSNLETATETWVMTNDLFEVLAQALGMKTPRVGHCSSQGLVELGNYEINRLRRSARVQFFAWTPIPGIPVLKNKPKSPRYDRMKLAGEYQAILDSGKVETRAELARYLGVSRARVTQVLNRLK